MEKMDFGLEVKSEDVRDDGIFSGYASTFGGEPDSYGDVVAPGAFKNTILKGGRNRNGVAMLWQHNSDQPIGVWQQLVEDSKGLAVLGKLALDTQIGKEAHALLKMGAIKGISIGYSTVDHEYNSQTKVRTLKEVDLYEASLVTFPANIRAQVTGVKELKDAKCIREFETLLREAGLSVSQSKYMLSLCRDSLSKRFPCDEETKIDTAASIFKLLENYNRRNIV